MRRTAQQCWTVYVKRFYSLLRISSPFLKTCSSHVYWCECVYCNSSDIRKIKNCKAFILVWETIHSYHLQAVSLNEDNYPTQNCLCCARISLAKWAGFILPCLSEGCTSSPRWLLPLAQASHPRSAITPSWPTIWQTPTTASTAAHGLSRHDNVITKTSRKDRKMKP